MTDVVLGPPTPAVQVRIPSALAEPGRVSGLRPVAEGERLVLLDVLRGFALFGILLANFNGVPDGSAVDEVANVLLGALVTNSFRPLFGLLFGIGFAVHFARARERKGAGAHLYFRRTLVLFLIGTFHAVVIWQGDILVHYSLIALVLLPLNRVPARVIGLLAIAVFAFNVFAPARASTLQRLDVPQRAVAAEMASGVANEQLLIVAGLEAAGGIPRPTLWIEALRERWQRYAAGTMGHSDWRRFTVSDSLLAFLIGIVIGGTGYLRDPRRHGRFWLAVALLGTVIAAAGYAYGRLGIDWGAKVGYLAGFAADFTLALVYMAAIALILSRGGVSAARLGLLAPAGRMALTNYLMQSVVMTGILYSYGLNLPWPGALLMIALQAAFFFLVQIPLSRWWLSRYHFGPAEWVWRSLTYGGLQPMKRTRG